MLKIFKLNKLLKNKWVKLLLFFIIFYILYIFYKYHKISKHRRLNLLKQENINNKTNQYLEKQGQISNDIINVKQTQYNFNYKNNSNKLNKVTVNNNEKQRYHPIVIKISNIIIGRYNIGKLIPEKSSKLLINVIYQNVDKHISNYLKNTGNLSYNVDEFSSLKQINDTIIDSHKFNELVDKITLIISRILFKVVEDPLTKILIGQYIIKKSNSNKEIDDIYLYFINISKNTRLSVDVRMNVIDILNLSNNKKYIEVSKSLLQNVRNNNINNSDNNTTITFNNNLNRISNIVKNKAINKVNNVNNSNINQTNRHNPPQLLVDIDGTTYPIPPDINVPPLTVETEVKKPEKSIYDDSQNVHNTTINQSTLNTATEMIKMYDPGIKTIDYVYYKTKSIDEFSIEKIEKSIHRINTDTSTFGKGFTLYTIYQSLLNLIEQHPQKRDMDERLLDELIDMSGKCSTGHLSRLINVLQGFETNLQVKVKININDEIYAKIKHLIEQSITDDENMDEIMEDMLSENKTVYINFVNKVINDNILEMIKEYEKVNINDISGYNNYKKYDKISEIILDIVVNSLDKYTGTKDNFTYLITKK